MLKSSVLPNGLSNSNLSKRLNSINIQNEAHLKEWKAIAKYAYHNKTLEYSILNQIKRKLRKPIDKVIFPVGSKSRIFIKKIIKRN